MASSTDKVKKSEVQEFWSRRVPLVEPSANPGELDTTYYDRIDQTNLRYNPFLKKVHRHLAKSGKSILEIGCGAGADSRAFAKLGLDVISLDLTRRSCEITKRGYDVYGIAADVLQADAENLPLRDSSVDIAYSFGVIHHTPNTDAAASEIHRVIRNNAFVMLYNRNLSYYAKRIRHPRLSEQEVFNIYDYTILSKLYSKREVRRLFRAFGEIKIERRMFWAGKDSKFLHLLIMILHVTGVERIYGSFNLVYLEKSAGHGQQHSGSKR